MKLKKEYLFLLLAIAALSAYLVMRSKDQTHFELPKIAQVESQKVNRLEITKGDQTIQVNKKDDQWTIGPNAYPADSIKVKNMVNAAAGLNLTALVSESGNYDRYDLTESKKVNVRAYADKDMLRDFDIGRLAPTQQHTFVKLMDNPKVYHAQGNIDTTFDTTVDALREKKVLTYQKEDINSLTISKGDQNLTISKKEVSADNPDLEGEKKEEQSKAAETQWMDSNGTLYAKSDVDRLIGSFAQLKCDDYMEDDAKESLNDPLWTVTLNSDSGKYMLSVFNKENDASTHQPALSSGSDYAFKLNKSRTETYEKHIDRLLNPGGDNSTEKEIKNET